MLRMCNHPPAGTALSAGGGPMYSGKIGEVQKRLLAPSLAAGDRQSALDELERLEAEEEDLRDALARQDPTFARRRAPSIPSLAELQARLAGDQALLLYQLSRHGRSAWRKLDAGGSWVVVMTRDEARAIALPDEDVLEAQIAVFVGLFLRRDGSERAAAGELGHALLAAALNEAPPRVRRLVIVPDGVLHQLPFEALAVDGSGAPVIERYEVAYAPSAALWLRWQRGRPAGHDRGRPVAGRSAAPGRTSRGNPAHRRRLAGGVASRPARFAMPRGKHRGGPGEAVAHAVRPRRSA